MYGYVTGMGYLSQSWRGLGDEAADTATAYSQVGIALNKDQTQSVGQLISTFQTEFPLMTVDDARWAAQAGMLQFIRPQQPAIPLSSLAAAISQLGIFGDNRQRHKSCGQFGTHLSNFGVFNKS